MRPGARLCSQTFSAALQLMALLPCASPLDRLLAKREVIPRCEIVACEEEKTIHMCDKATCTSPRRPKVNVSSVQIQANLAMHQPVHEPDQGGGLGVPTPLPSSCHEKRAAEAETVRTTSCTTPRLDVQDSAAEFGQLQSADLGAGGGAILKVNVPTTSSPPKSCALQDHDEDDDFEPNCPEKQPLWTPRGVVAASRGTLTWQSAVGNSQSWLMRLPERHGSTLVLKRRCLPRERGHARCSRHTSWWSPRDELDLIISHDGFA